MNGINRVILLGNLGKDPDMSYTSTGKAVTKFSLAVGDNKQVNGEWTNETDWFNIVAWGQTAENCAKYLNKGSRVYVEGKMKSRKYTGKDGVERTTFEVIIDKMVNQTAKNGQEPTTHKDDDNDDNDELDEHPF